MAKVDRPRWLKIMSKRENAVMLKKKVMNYKASNEKKRERPKKEEEKRTGLTIGAAINCEK